MCRPRIQVIKGGPILFENVKSLKLVGLDKSVKLLIESPKPIHHFFLIQNSPKPIYIWVC